MRRSGKEFGDWQTPETLATRVCARLGDDGIRPLTIFEPTCGIGRFVRAALRQWPSARVIGVDIQSSHVVHARASIPVLESSRVTLEVGDIFRPNSLSVELSRPTLILGNPPWVTNSALGALGKDNLPEKWNVDLLSGLDALTGKANFDLAEAVLLRMLASMRDGDVLAMLVKTSTAQRTLSRLWKKIDAAVKIFRIDAKQEFGASVEACLLVIDRRRNERICEVFDTLESPQASGRWFLENGRLVAQQTADEVGPVLPGTGRMWRSGVKHDASKVLELCQIEGKGLVNGSGESVEVEPDLLFPLLKSSDVANGRFGGGRFVLLPQRDPREDTRGLADALPKTSQYLIAHGAALDARKSSIYRNRPRFAIFGVGPYTFSLWKVAVSGLYGNFRFQAVGPRDGKPVVFDDTVNLLACEDEDEARGFARYCNEEAAQSYLRARAMPGAKRPLTVDLLRSLPMPESNSALQSALF